MNNLNNNNNSINGEFPCSPEISTNFAPHSPICDDSRVAKSHQNQNPRKKRTKLMRIDNPIGRNFSPMSNPSTSTSTSTRKKPDPGAPKITRPCSECGKKFWSWKALFGHMRCHPERQWRGINPPPNFKPQFSPDFPVHGDPAPMSDDDHEVASCLLLLANSATAPTTTTATANANAAPLDEVPFAWDVAGLGSGGEGDSRFECSSCKKAFGSHQALGGHRASHKNVKGCYAITRTGDIGEGGCTSTSTGTNLLLDRIGDRYGEREMEGKESEGNDTTAMELGHKCSICLRVFSSGQALGGHKRCHWEKIEESSSTAQRQGGCLWDLNLPPPPPPPPTAPEDDCYNSSSSYSPALDLRLGL